MAYTSSRRLTALALAAALAAPAALLSLSPALRHRVQALWLPHTVTSSAPQAQSQVQVQPDLTTPQSLSQTRSDPLAEAAPVAQPMPNATFGEGELGQDAPLAPTSAPAPLPQGPKLETFEIPDEKGPQIAIGAPPVQGQVIVGKKVGDSAGGCLHRHSRVDTASKKAGYAGSAPDYDPCPIGYYGTAPAYGQAPGYGQAAGYHGAAPAYGQAAGYSGQTAGYSGKKAGYSDKAAGY